MPKIKIKYQKSDSYISQKIYIRNYNHTNRKKKTEFKIPHIAKKMSAKRWYFYFRDVWDFSFWCFWYFCDLYANDFWYIILLWYVGIGFLIFYLIFGICRIAISDIFYFLPFVRLHFLVYLLFSQHVEFFCDNFFCSVLWSIFLIYIFATCRTFISDIYIFCHLCDCNFWYRFIFSKHDVGFVFW